ncbi:hypothetical protein [Jiella sp. M17.18]|uniref:hypothetical protein n=1 Tax=Jiella sp. M17.18 TaxID=3234247 RepID=UPI0034DF5119
MLFLEAVPDEANELAAIPELAARLGEEGGLEGPLAASPSVARLPTQPFDGCRLLSCRKGRPATPCSKAEAAILEAPEAGSGNAVETTRAMAASSSAASAKWPVSIG